ncbi:ATP-dependent Clp protease ATP-binding subunit clpX-like, mitochondrial [Caerostris darwini]|uniref:ATP-dependent Clp protease ATP-binding subunit clpX-like, mitochondrial n=1 Tax=Caerostris darwini TaxID=1538125 RepID=A0AAV4TL58_9ARAC|nr:ATP-dependent Clp protease ATP-binding subunit clpX-like, mitochondrial [Caerostris darwini]
MGQLHLPRKGTVSLTSAECASYFTKKSIWKIKSNYSNLFCAPLIRSFSHFGSEKCGCNCIQPKTIDATTFYTKCNQCNTDFVFRTDIDSGIKYTEIKHTETNDQSKKEKCSPLLPLPPPPPKKIFEYLNQYVVGQNHAKKVLSVAVYNHYKRIYKTSHLNQHAVKGNLQVYSQDHFSQCNASGEKFLQDQINKGSFMKTKYGSDTINVKYDDINLEKSNVLLLGPTGCGKTLLAQTIARCLDVPFVICDCTTLTEAGYKGQDIETIISKLLSVANKNVNKAQKGIVFLDEIDKIGARHSVGDTRDVGGEGVQQALLKMIEGSLCSISQSGIFSRRTTVVDTSNILFIASGAFNGLDRIIGKRKSGKVLGFDAMISESPSKISLTSDVTNFAAEDNAESDTLLACVQPKDLIEFGMIPEFIGRFPIVTSLHSLDENTLIQILTEPKNALVKQFQKLFDMDEVELKFSEDALKAIAYLAMERRTGARGLRAILEKILLDAMFEIPCSDIDCVIITKAVVEGKFAPVYSQSQERRERLQ